MRKGISGAHLRGDLRYWSQHCNLQLILLPAFSSQTSETVTPIQREKSDCTRNEDCFHSVCHTHTWLYKHWIPFPSLFPCLCHAHNTDPHWTGLCCSLDLLPVWSRYSLSGNGLLSYFQSLGRKWCENRGKEQNAASNAADTPQSYWPSLPHAKWSSPLLAGSPAPTPHKVSTGKTATQYFRNYSDLIAKKDRVLAQHMVNGEAVYFSSAATSGVCRAGSFFLDHYIFLQLFLELQFCNCFFSLPGRLRSQTMKKELWR